MDKTHLSPWLSIIFSKEYLCWKRNTDMVVPIKKHEPSLALRIGPTQYGLEITALVSYCRH